MKSPSTLSLAGLCVLALSSCDPAILQNTSTANDETRRQLEETRAAYEQQAADMQARSANLQSQLVDLQKSIQEKENAELQAKLDAIQQENTRLLADADEARRKSEELRDLLTSQTIAATPLATPAPAQVEPRSPAPAQAWTDPEADYSPFYEDLTPYGQWLDVEGYGYAWRPHLAQKTSWRPYVDGRWVWSEYGWGWDTPEPFGWACYHYGRWVSIARHGWVWVPGREWAPAWVSWRSGGDYLGWAPLPPEPRFGYTSVGYDCDVRYGLSPSSYFFIESNHFGRSSYLNFSVGFGSVVNIFHQTVNVTNIVRVHQQQTNFFVHRGGPDRDWLERRIGARLPQVPVRIGPALDREHNRGSRDGQPGFVVASLAPKLPERPRTIPKGVEKVTRPTIDDQWGNVPEERRKGLRDTIAQQAREPRSTIAAPTVPEKPGATRPSVVAEPTPEPNGRPQLPQRPGLTTRPELPQRPGTAEPEVRPAIPVKPAPVAEKTPDGRSNLPTRPSATLPQRPSLSETAPTGTNPLTRPTVPQKPNDTSAEEKAARLRAAMTESREAAGRDAALKEAAAKRYQLAAAQKQAEMEKAVNLQKIAEAQRISEALRQKQAESMKTRALLEQQAEATRQKTDMNRRAEAEAKMRRDAETSQRAEISRRQSLENQAEKGRQAALAKQQDAARRAQESAVKEQRQQMESRQKSELAQRQREATADRSREAAARAAQQNQEMAQRAQAAAQRAQVERQRAAVPPQPAKRPERPALPGGRPKREEEE